MSRQRPHLLLTLCVLLAVSGIGDVSPAAAQQTGVQWQHDIEAAKATARQTGKLVLVHFWTRSCGPCLMLDQNVFNQPGVAGAIESQFVPVKLNADENPATATGFGITRVPTDVILTADGQVVGKLISPPTPAAYVAELSQVAAQHQSKGVPAFARAAESGPLSPQLNAAYANLQIAPNTPPALEAQQVATTSDPYAMPPSVATGSVSAPSPGFIGTAPSIQNGTHDPWTYSPANNGAGAVPSITRPQGAAVPSPYDQYAPATGPMFAAPTPAEPVTAPLAASPVQTVNPNAGVTPSAPEQSVNPYGSVTSPTPGPTANPYASATLAPVTPATPATPPMLPSAAAAPMQQNPLQQTPPSAGAAPARSTAAAQATAADSPPVGFEGYCPVSMRNHWKWVPGDPRWGIIHRGRTYYFAGQNEQQQFWADPDRYSPALSGMDPVLAIDHKQQVPGKREHSIDYDNLFYMFASEATLQQFTANPERYATSVRQAMGIQRGRLVR